MTTTEELADFIQTVSYESLSADVVEELEKRVLDSVGIGIGALDAEPIDVIATRATEFEQGGPCHLWGRDETVPPAQAAMYNTALTRYLDFMDSFLAPGETPHPSDNIASIIVCGEIADASGRDIIEGIGVAYEVQGELAWNAPVLTEDSITSPTPSSRRRPVRAKYLI